MQAKEIYEKMKHNYLANENFSFGEAVRLYGKYQDEFYMACRYLVRGITRIEEDKVWNEANKNKPPRRLEFK